MYAVVITGGKQYRVSPGDVMIVDRLPGDSGDRVELSQVLMLDDGKKLQVGQPFLGKTAIAAEILEQKRSKKIIVFKKKRRQGYRRKHGHRQHQTVLRVLEFGGGAASADKPVQAKDVDSKPVAAKQTAEKAAATKPKATAASNKAKTKTSTTKAEKE